MNTEASHDRLLRLALRAATPLLLCMAGCGGKYATHAVEGTLTDSAGKPLSDVLVICERTVEPMVARGITDERGRFRLGTLRPDDGAPLGTYRVALSQQSLADADLPVPRRFASRYESPETSGINFEVVPGRNRFDLKLEPPD
jgi:hypothetical protein